MKIIKTKVSYIIAHNNKVYRRNTNGFWVIFGKSKKGKTVSDIEKRELEEEYQKLINKPVETTNELPKRKSFLEELKEHENTGRTCFCGESKFCDC